MHVAITMHMISSREFMLTDDEWLPSVMLVGVWIVMVVASLDACTCVVDVSVVDASGVIVCVG